MSKDINKEIEELAEDMEKSTKTPKELLFETIRALGPEGLRAKLPTLEKSEQELLRGALEEMKKAVSMDDEYQAKYVQGKIADTKLQEDKADDDQDEKLVKPEAAKHNHQGTPVEGWEGQVIKGDKMSEKKEKKMSEKMSDAVEEIAEGEAKEEVEDHNKKMHKKDMEKSEEELKEELVALKKSVEEELGEDATPELVKAEMKKRLLKEEEQSDDELDDLQKEKVRGDKKRPEELKLEEDNKDAQKKVDDMKQGVKKALWAPENDLLKACGSGQNHHFSINDYYDEVLKEADAPKEEVKKSETESEEDINDIIEKGGDQTWDTYNCDKQIKENQEKINGKFSKSFADNEIAEALGLTEEEAKKILGE